MQLNREQLIPLLDKLTHETPSQFGNLKPQEMIEHITVTFQTSSNQKQWSAPQDAEKANAAKQYMIYTDAEMPQGLKTAPMEELLPPLIHATMIDAKECLYNEIEIFHNYFKNNPEAQTNPTIKAVRNTRNGLLSTPNILSIISNNLGCFKMQSKTPRIKARSAAADLAFIRLMSVIPNKILIFHTSNAPAILKSNRIIGYNRFITV